MRSRAFLLAACAATALIPRSPRFLHKHMPGITPNTAFQQALATPTARDAAHTAPTSSHGHTKDPQTEPQASSHIATRAHIHGSAPPKIHTGAARPQCTPAAHTHGHPAPNNRTLTTQNDTAAPDPAPHAQPSTTLGAEATATLAAAQNRHAARQGWGSGTLGSRGGGEQST